MIALANHEPGNPEPIQINAQFQHQPPPPADQSSRMKRQRIEHDQSAVQTVTTAPKRPSSARRHAQPTPYHVNPSYVLMGNSWSRLDHFTPSSYKPQGMDNIVDFLASHYPNKYLMCIAYGKNGKINDVQCGITETRKTSDADPKVTALRGVREELLLEVHRSSVQYLEKMFFDHTKDTVSHGIINLDKLIESNGFHQRITKEMLPKDKKVDDVEGSKAAIYIIGSKTSIETVFKYFGSDEANINGFVMVPINRLNDIF